MARRLSPSKRENTMSTQCIELTDSTFEAETRSGVTLIFFWDPFESGCRREWKIIEKAADAIGKHLKIGRCSFEKSPVLAERLAIRSIPTTLLFKDGREKERLVGLRHEGTLIRRIMEYLEQDV